LIALCAKIIRESHALEHDPEKWEPVSRLREAMQPLAFSCHASAGEARSEKIMLHQNYSDNRFNLERRRSTTPAEGREATAGFHGRARIENR
jgi:hypothetical protein